jgi:FAD/FMN-containing dehydrogenase
MEADWVAFGRSLTGSLVRPNDPGYATAHQLFDPLFDAVRPQAVVACGNESDVQRSLAFARDHGITPTPRGGGHSYAGYSTGTGMVVDVGPLSAIGVDGGAGTATVGAGAHLVDLYAAVAPHGVAIPGGTCPTVGISGLALGGGHGVIARKLGLTCDSVRAVRIVTAAGDLLTCDEASNPDLFWASRGGGGGNFGVVTRFTFATHPIGDLTLFSLSWPWSAAADVLAAWQSWGPSVPDELWSDCHLLARSGDPPGPLKASVNGAFVGSSSALSPYLATLRGSVGSEPSSSSVNTESYGAAMMGEAGCSHLTVAQCHLPTQNRAGVLKREGAVAKSDFFASPIGSTAVADAIAAIEDRQGDPTLSTTGGVLFDAYGGAINRVAPGATAFVHRRERFVAQYFANLPTGASKGTVTANRTWLNGLYGTLHPDASGYAYQNYIDADLADWQQAYYGSNLARLELVKRTYDPDGLFRFAQGIPPD